MTLYSDSNEHLPLYLNKIRLGPRLPTPQSISFESIGFPQVLHHVHLIAFVSSACSCPSLVLGSVL